MVASTIFNTSTDPMPRLAELFIFSFRPLTTQLSHNWTMGKLRFIAGGVAFVIVILIILCVWRVVQRQRVKSREAAGNSNPAPNAI